MDYNSKYNTADCLPGGRLDETVKIYIPGSFSNGQESELLSDGKIRIYSGRKKLSGENEQTDGGMLSFVSDDR